MSTNKQALREAAEKATQGKWKAFIHTASRTCSVHTPRDKRCDNVVKWSGFDGQKNAEANAKFIAAANPATVLALLDELDEAEYQRDNIQRVNCGLFDKLTAAEKRIAELTTADGNLIAWESTTPVYIKLITDEHYQKLRPGYRKWYKPYRCSNCAAGITVKGE